MEILEIASAVPEPVEPVPVRVGAGAAVEVEPDIFEMKSAAEEHQRQCHKGARKGRRFLLLPVYLYWPEHIVSCLLDAHMVQVV